MSVAFEHYVPTASILVRLLLGVPVSLGNRWQEGIPNYAVRKEKIEEFRRKSLGLCAAKLASKPVGYAKITQDAFTKCACKFFVIISI
jgi:hypothetical protein